MARLEVLTDRSVNDRRLCLLPVEDAEHLIGSLDALEPYFVCLVLLDGDRLTPSAMIPALDRLVARSGCYFCCWGPDCDVLDNLLDETIVVLELGGRLRVGREEHPIVTTWHANESLEEAIWFAVHLALPDGPYADCDAVVVVCATRFDHLDTVRTLLRHPELLNNADDTPLGEE